MIDLTPITITEAPTIDQAAQLRPCEQPVCPTCGQVLPLPAPKIIQANASTIADNYDVWPTGKRGKRIGPKVRVIELKVQR